ncbi:MAG TPA: OsmC family protein [Candidatus Limnocylindria bacterium]|nr:OsmC family protein [Candidatus Limnocylindria bacterium]
MQTLSTRIAESAERFRADPASGITNPTVTATLLNGHARLSSGPFNWETDLGPAVGGENLAPSPTAYLLGALAGCGVVFLRDTLAPEFGVTVTAVEASASCRADVAGLLGVDGTTPALGDIRLEVRVTSPDPQERIDAMFAAWRERCPIYLALRDANDVALDLQAAG